MHYFENFKSFAKAEIDLFKPLTILIGPNGSGKSNLIEGVELLSFLAQGGSLYEITDINKGSRQEIRGGLQGCPHRDNKYFTLGFSGQINFDKKNYSFMYRLSIEKESLRIVDESLHLDDILFFEVIPRNLLKDLAEIYRIKKSNIASKNDVVPYQSNQHILQIRYNNFIGVGQKPHAYASPMQSLLSQYKSFAIKTRKIKDTENVVNGIAKYLQASFVFDPNPKLMRDYERIGNKVLTKNGSNLSGVLYGLSQGDEKEQQSLKRILSWIQQVPNEPYQDFEFVTVPQLNDVIFALREAGTERLNSAGILSDGTLRCLAVLTALETVSSGVRIIIEEFDNGLHPSRVGILVKAIEECSKRRKLNVLVTTHNPATLNALQPQQLDGVISCIYDSKEQATKLIPLSKLPRYIEFMERGKLGDLVTQRILEEYLAPNFEENRKKEALEWLNNL